MMVWPALAPPWNRTTTSDSSANISVILPRARTRPAKQENPAEGKALKDVLNDRIAKIGEKLDFRRFEKLTTEGQIAGYIHGAGKIGVLVELLTEARDERVIAMGRDIAMQVAAMNPKYVSREDVDPAYIAHETEVLTAQALNEGKPANIVEKMVKGRLEKELKEVCLLEQVFVKDSDLTIKKLVEL